MIANRYRSLLIAGAACAFMACAHAVRGPRYENLEVRLVSESGGQSFPEWGEPGTMLLEPEVFFSGKDFAKIESSHGGDDKECSVPPTRPQF